MSTLRQGESFVAYINTLAALRMAYDVKGRVIFFCLLVKRHVTCCLNPNCLNMMTWSSVLKIRSLGLVFAAFSSGLQGWFPDYVPRPAGLFSQNQKFGFGFRSPFFSLQTARLISWSCAKTSWSVFWEHLYSCCCEALRAHLETRRSTSVRRQEKESLNPCCSLLMWTLRCDECIL